MSFRIIGVLEAIVYHSKTGQVLHPYRLWMQGADYRVCAGTLFSSNKISRARVAVASGTS